MSISEPRQGPSDIVRPFLWLAVVAFLVGFSIALLVGYRQVAAAHGPWRAALLSPKGSAGGLQSHGSGVSLRGPDVA